jgi:hypothetical protein
MKPMENTEDFVRRGKAEVSADPQMDSRVLNDAFAAMDAAMVGRSSAARMMLRNRWVRIAAAAVITLVIGLLAIQWGPTEQPSVTSHVVKSPADMVSAMSLNMAYRRGGIEAVDNLADVAFALPESKPARLSIQELLTESNGV